MCYIQKIVLNFFPPDQNTNYSPNGRVAPTRFGWKLDAQNLQGDELNSMDKQGSINILKFKFNIVKSWVFKILNGIVDPEL